MQKVHKTKKGVFIFQDGHTYFFDKRVLMFDGASAQTVDTTAQGLLVSPMPGKVFRLLVAPKQSVKAGQDVVIVEAMKMEHALKAPFEGVVQSCFVKEGEQVELGQKLVEIVLTSQELDKIFDDGEVDITQHLKLKSITRPSRK